MAWFVILSFKNKNENCRDGAGFAKLTLSSQFCSVFPVANRETTKYDILKKQNTPILKSFLGKDKKRQLVKI